MGTFTCLKCISGWDLKNLFYKLKAKGAYIEENKYTYWIIFKSSLNIIPSYFCDIPLFWVYYTVRMTLNWPWTAGYSTLNRQDISSLVKRKFLFRLGILKKPNPSLYVDCTVSRFHEFISGINKSNMLNL